ncbi:ATP-dependent nuclease [Pelagibius marinus]|uniref:ATP-dependent nuclease n=1 Tax=Pelagibius marinus TaxID=2762760 RepID=UPI001872D1F9|nr:AAA family ATPase [Pelagibius marinus]
MRIRHIEIKNFRGIQSLCWAPGQSMNCLIGPGDSTKTTVLDAIELALNPRSYFLGDDADFHNLDVEQPVKITLTMGDLPVEFLAENKYGLHLRGWDAAAEQLHDEPDGTLEEVLSLRVTIDKSLEARWSLFNERIAQAEGDPPMIRYKDMQTLATSRLGPYAKRHLGWGRQSVLSQIEESGESVNLRLAEAGRAARSAFKESGTDVFSATVEKVQKLSADFSVPVRDKYKAELDVQSVSVSTGGIALHDGALPLRRLGTGSSRLLVSALQHEAASSSHVALIDEVEHGLEPHRIARLLKFLKGKKTTPSGDVRSQIFLTTHSPVVVRELDAGDIFTVRETGGDVGVRSAASTPENAKKIQAHLRVSPEAFLARRVLVGEGRTEAGLLRGLDSWWTDNGKPSCAYQGAVIIHGDGKDSGPDIAESLLDLGYQAALLLDSDEAPNPQTLDRVRSKGGKIVQWEGDVSTEGRLFADLKWEAVREVMDYLTSELGEDAIRAHINNVLAESQSPPLGDLTFPAALDTKAFRQTLAAAAVAKKGQKRASWIKDLGRAEAIGYMIGADLGATAGTPFAAGITKLRQWIDGG